MKLRLVESLWPPPECGGARPSRREDEFGGGSASVLATAPQWTRTQVLASALPQVLSSRLLSGSIAKHRQVS